VAFYNSIRGEERKKKMKTCETCKWWTGTESPYSKKHRACENGDVVEFQGDSESYAMVDVDDCGGGAGLYFRKDFGCIKWETKG